MESERNPSAAEAARSGLAGLGRAEILTHTRYPRLGRWYPPAFGSLGAAFVAAYAAPLWPRLAIWVVVVMLAGAGIGWYVRKRGVIPDMRQSPPALRREAKIFFFCYLLSLAIIAVCYLAIGWLAGALSAFVLLTVLIAVYEARYDLAAQQVEAEAGFVG